IRQCTLRGDWKLYGTYIHAVRGVTAIIGARAMSEKARELELACVNEDAEFILDNTEDVLEELETLLGNIQGALPTEARLDVGLSDEDRDFLTQRLSGLKRALEELDSTAITDATRALEARTWDDNTLKLLEEISNYILMFDYEDAIKVIEKIL
ncbi:MAG: hypothetical protein LBR83_08740, partial [Clostridiales bacterium]|nr:hypothetical protein [Clostridiales bacterium]